MSDTSARRSLPYRLRFATTTLAATSLLAVPIAAALPAQAGASSSITAASLASALSPSGALTSDGTDWLHTDGNRVVDASGKEVWLTGANWFGFNASERVFHGLWTANIETTTKGMADRGINVVRVPISTQLLQEWRKGQTVAAPNLNAYANPELRGMNNLQVFDYWLELCKKYGLKVILDVHSAEADNSGHFAPMWFKGSITTEDVYTGWEWFTERYKNNDTVIGADLKNEPHGSQGDAERAKWDSSTDKDNFKYFAETAASRILAINPNMLILVEGVQIYPKAGKSWTSTNVDDYTNYWWGGNLKGVAEHPVNLGAHQDQLMYSPHDYGPLVSPQPWFEGTSWNRASLERDVWGPNWLYIHDQEIAPLLIGEWGGFLDNGPNQKWMLALRDTIKEKRIHHTFWVLNPNSGDTGGLLNNDWVSWDEAKYALLKPALWAEGGKFVSLDHEVKLGGSASTTGISLSQAPGGTTNPPVDTTSPSVPTALTAGATTTSSIALSWTASTDNVAVTGYDIYRGGTLIGSTAGTSYTATGLAANSAFTFTVRAKDAAGNTSAASAATTASTQAVVVADTTSPSVPTALTAGATTTSTIALSWTASTDNVAVTGYDVYRGATLVGSSAGTSYTATGLTDGTGYTFTVRAKDAAGNVSAASAPVTATTKTAVVVDSTSPTVPVTVTAGSPTTTTVPLSWTASTDNVGVTGYDVYRGGTLVGSTTTTTFTATGLTDGTSYTFTVRAKDAAGNVSAASAPVTVTTLVAVVADTTAPTVPVALTAGTTTTSSIALTWSASTDNVGVTGYDVYQGQTKIASTVGTSYTVANLASSTGYTFTVRAKDAAGNTSASSSPVTATTQAVVVADTTAPTVPTGLVAGTTTTTGIPLTWSASTDDVAVTGYDVYQGATWIASTVGTSFTVTGLTPSTSYTFTVRAKDAAGNASAASTSVTASTQAAVVVDAVAPSVPAALTAGVTTTTSIPLTWSAATDNIGVTGYDIYQGQTKIGSSPTTSYSVTGLTAGTAYTFSVRAKDAAGNVSAASAQVTASTQAAVVPAGTCQVTYSTNDWNSGFTGSLKIKNTSTAAITSWSVGFAFPAGQVITNGWSALYAQTGSQVTVANQSWNGWIPAGGTVEIGFNANHNGTNTAPAEFTLNGSTCSKG